MVNLSVAVQNHVSSYLLNKTIYIQGLNAQAYRVSFFDMHGQQVDPEVMVHNSSCSTLSVKAPEISTGVLFVAVSGTRTRRFVPVIIIQK